MMVSTISIWRRIQFCNFYMHSRLSYSESDILSVTHILRYNIVRFGSVLHALLKLKNKGNFFLLFSFLFLFFIFLLQKNIDAEVLKWRARRPETIVFFCLSINMLQPRLVLPFGISIAIDDLLCIGWHHQFVLVLFMIRYSCRYSYLNGANISGATIDLIIIESAL